jgi:putative hemolysin
VQRPDGSWLLDGTLPADAVSEIVGLGQPERIQGYQTLAGFLLSQLGRIPNPGNRVEWKRFSFEVVVMDGRRVDKVLVGPIGGTDQEGMSGAS